MKVKIIKSKYDDYWYNKYIGEKFEVEESGAVDYIITDGESEYYSHYILREDCEIVNEEEEIIEEIIEVKENKNNLYYNTNLQMYHIKLQDYKIKVVCNKCYKNGQVDEKCSQCGGKGIHNKTKQKWEVNNKLVSIDKIDRDEKGELRYWEDKSCFFCEMDKYLHFRYQDAKNECKRRNNELELGL